MIKVLSRKPVFKADLFDVFETEVELPNGETHTYHDAVRKTAISAFPLTDNHEIYLIDQYRYLHKGRIIEAVAGFIEESEKPIDAAKRELKEETGIEAETWQELSTVDAAGSIITWEQPLFLAKNLKLGQATPEDSEDIKLVKFTLSQAVELVMSGVIRTASSIVGILMIDKLVQEGKL